MSGKQEPTRKKLVAIDAITGFTYIGGNLHVDSHNQVLTCPATILDYVIVKTDSLISQGDEQRSYDDNAKTAHKELARSKRTEIAKSQIVAIHSLDNL